MRGERRQRLSLWLTERGISHVGEREWHELLEFFAPIDDRNLRRLLREAGVAVDHPFAGIRQDSFPELESSLILMERAYAAAIAAGDRNRAQLCRRIVIEAKDRAKLASRNPRLSAETRARKQDMAEWMLVWLENPGVFRLWVRLRRLAAESRPPESGRSQSP